MSENFNFDNTKIGNFAINVHGEQKYINKIVNKNNIPNDEELKKIVDDFQNIIIQLKQEYPTSDNTDLTLYANKLVQPSLKKRMLRILQVGAESAIEELLDNPYINIGKAILKSWSDEDT